MCGDVPWMLLMVGVGGALRLGAAGPVEHVELPAWLSRRGGRPGRWLAAFQAAQFVDNYTCIFAAADHEGG